jgi:hypothetical protein
MTAIEYLINEILEDHTEHWHRVIQVALKKEKEQIMNAYNEGYRDGDFDSAEPYPDDISNYNNAEQYYKSLNQ